MLYYFILGRELTLTDMDDTALVEPLSVGWHAVTRGITEHTTSALVMGAGPIGLCAVQALQARKIPKIIIADVNVDRQAAARQAGAHHFLNPATEDVAVACARLCKDSGGVHVAFDTAGKQVTLDTCLSAVSVGGTVVNIAIWGSKASLSPNLLTLGEKRYMGSPVYTREDFDEVIQAIASGEWFEARMFFIVIIGVHHIRIDAKTDTVFPSRPHQPSIHGDFQDCFVPSRLSRYTETTTRPWR